MPRTFNEHLYEPDFIARFFRIREVDWRLVYAADRVTKRGHIRLKESDLADFRINGYGYRLVQLPRFVHPENGVYALISHRAIWALHNKKNPGRSIIDHIDLNKLNNNPENFRMVNDRESLVNRTNTGIRSKLGVMGVAVDPRAPLHTRRFQAKTRGPDRKMINIGCFHTLREAADAYDAWIIERHGSDAPTNASLGLLP